MPNPSFRFIHAMCRRHIAQRYTSLPSSAARRVAQIVLDNISSKRYDRLVRASQKRPADRPLSLAVYVDRVLDCFLLESQRVDRLAAGDPAEWKRLRELLNRRGLSLCRKFSNCTNPQADAEDLANETCTTLFAERFPFDCTFEAWAAKILKNLVLARYTRSTDAMYHHTAPASLDEKISSDPEGAEILGNLIADAQSRAPFEKVENQMLLIGVIEGLRSPEQRLVIVETYLKGQSDVQVARRLGKSKQAVYNLRNRALSRLRKLILEPTPVKETRSKSI